MGANSSSVDMFAKYLYFESVPYTYGLKQVKVHLINTCTFDSKIK